MKIEKRVLVASIANEEMCGDVNGKTNIKIIQDKKLVVVVFGDDVKVYTYDQYITKFTLPGYQWIDEDEIGEG